MSYRSNGFDFCSTPIFQLELYEGEIFHVRGLEDRDLYVCPVTTKVLEPVMVQQRQPWTSLELLKISGLCI